MKNQESLAYLFQGLDCVGDVPEWYPCPEKVRDNVPGWQLNYEPISQPWREEVGEHGVCQKKKQKQTTNATQEFQRCLPLV